MRKKLRLFVGAALAALVVVPVGLIVLPSNDEPVPSDAIVMFAGGRGERLPIARGLAEEGLAPVLVIMNGTDPGWPRANLLCEGSFDYDVICPNPTPDNTRGEAATTAQLAEDNGWGSVLLVTSDYHLRRASTLLHRCFAGEITSVAAVGDLGFLPRVRSVLREVAALASLWAETDC